MKNKVQSPDALAHSHIHFPHFSVTSFVLVYLLHGFPSLPFFIISFFHCIPNHLNRRPDRLWSPPSLVRGAAKSLDRPTSRCILMVTIFRLMLVLLYIYIYIYIYSTNIPPVMIINRIYVNQNLLSL